MDNNKTDCKTKYPIFFIHGAGFRDRNWLNYWGRIPTALTRNGCQIHYGNQDSWATIENNALVLKERIQEVLTETGAEKVNIIAHSKGGLEARYIISSLKMSDSVASLTTISTPHHGSETMDLICRFPTFLFKITSVLANLWFRILGDKNPDFHHVCRQFTTFHAKEFNQCNKNIEGVYYQSYAGVMNNSLSDIIMVIPHFVINIIEGESDGLVTPKSAKWANFKGILRGSTSRGISHADEVDLRRRKLCKKRKTGCVNDICDVYLKIVRDLKKLGY